MTTKALKDQALEEYYQALFQLHGMPGWRMLMEDVARMHQVHDSVSSLATQDQLMFRKGELSQMEWLLAHQSTIETAYASMIAEQEGEDEIAPTGGKATVLP